MQKFAVHLCLVSGQATPNLTPLLDPAFAPEKVVLAVSTDMKQQATWLEKVIRRKGIRVECLYLQDAYDYYGIADTFCDWLAEHEETAVALNVTGGTKIMAMAAQEMFRETGKPVFYVSAETDQVILLGNREASGTLPAKVRLRDYLEAHGYTVDGQIAKPDINRDQRELTQELVLNIRDHAEPLGKLNALAQAARSSLNVTLDDQQADSLSLRTLIDLFADKALLRRAVRARKTVLTFPDEAARQFVNGGWLESHVYATLADLAPQLPMSDYAVNLKVIARDGQTRNELDAAFLHRNTLHLIECKTANLGLLTNRGESKGMDAVNKLETQLKFGGLRTHGMLIDYRGSLTEADRKRAAIAGIHVVSGDALLRLKDEIRKWTHAA